MAVLLLLLLGLLQSPNCSSLHIKVCQNKDCCSRWKHTTPFPDVLSDMLEKNGGAAVSIETTSCLGQCGNGPNLSVTLPRSGEMFLRGLHDATTTVAHLESLLAAGDDDNDDTAVQVPSKLLAAVNVLDKAQKARTVQEEEHFLSSIIRALSASAEESNATVLARAHVLRADMHFRSSSAQSAAEQDVQQAIAILRRPTTADTANNSFSNEQSVERLHYQAFRLLADIRESQGDVLGAVEALRALAAGNRSMKTKVKLEIDRLQAKAL